MNENYNEMFNNLSVEEKSVLVVKFIKSLPKLDFKRILCNVLDVEHYMDDEGLRKATEKIINVRQAMERYNWIKAYYNSEEEVFVRQVESCSEYFISDKGNRFHISELDLTRSDYEHQIFNIEDFEKRNKEIEQQYKENQTMYLEMLSKMDANAIADHKAKIDEREYWRKLRGDIFMSMLEGDGTPEQCLEMTEMYFSRLYNQDKEFFKDK